MNCSTSGGPPRSLGIDNVWVADHWIDFAQPRNPWFEAWTLLGALAVQTQRIRFGPLIPPISFHNPAFLARKALTVDHISSGRMELGSGAGIPGAVDLSYSMIGIADFSGQERVERLNDGVASSIFCSVRMSLTMRRSTTE